MNNKLLSYSELVDKLKEYEELQKHNKNIRDTHCHWSVRAKFQKYVKKTKDKINMLHTAISHAKEARHLYEYKRRYEGEVLRGNCTANYISGVGTLVEEG